MRLSLFLIPLLLSSACSDAATYQSAVGTEQTATAMANAGAAGPEKGKGKARAVAEATGTYEFKYGYPAEAGAYPVLQRHLDTELSRSKAALVEESVQAKNAAEEEGFPYHAHYSSTTWEVVADLPGWLSLSRDIAVYSGGAHGMYGADGLVFDKRADMVRQPLDLFRSTAALQAAVEERWCAALDKEREERRGEPVDKSDEFFGDCPGIEELTLLLGSSNGETFDRIGLIAGPYVAGSYAEGGYEVTMGVDAAVIEAAKPEFRGAFAIKR